MPKKKTVKKIAGVAVVPPPPRKKRLSSTVFKPGNSHRFAKGVSGNPEGCKPHTGRDALLSRSLRVSLSDRAPDSVAEAMQCSKGASWSQCIAKKLIVMAIRGDLGAISEIRNFTESAHVALDLDFPVSKTPQLFELVFVPGVEGRPDPEFLATHPEFTTETKALPPTLSGAA
jgi:hypothetical protein